MSELRQSAPGDCGLVALEIVLAHHGHTSVRPALRRALGFVSTGVTAYALVMAARACGFDADAFEVTMDDLPRLPMPLILHWRWGHFVVLEGTADSGFSLVDPAAGRRWMSAEELSRRFSGVAIAVEPMVPAAATKGTTSGWPWSALGRGEWIWLGALPVVEAMLLVGGVVSLSRVAEQTLAGSPPTATAAAAVTSVVALVLVEARFVALNRAILSRLGERAAELFVDGLGSAPSEFVVSRGGGPLENTLVDVDPLLNRGLPRPAALARGIATPVVAASLAFVSVPAAAVVAIAGAVQIGSLAVDLVPSRRRARPPEGAIFHLRALLAATLRRPEDLIALGTFRRSLAQWLQARRNAASTTRERRTRLVAPPGAALAGWTSALFAVVLTELQQHRLSFGDALAAACLGATALLLLSDGLREVRGLPAWWRGRERLLESQREREIGVVAQVAARPDAPIADGPLLECRGLAYRESIDGGFELRDVDLVLHAGQSVAIVGASGSGKTLLAQLLLGVRRPVHGQVLTSGIDAAALDERGRAALLAGVLEDCGLAGSSIAAFLDPTRRASEEDVRRACAAVGLGRWIDRLPLGMRTPIARDGAHFASHQRRLLTLARVLIAAPRVAVIDGVLDGLDVDLARGIAESIGREVGAVVLLTARPEIVPDAYGRCRLIDGTLRPEPATSSEPRHASLGRVENEAIDTPDD